MLQQPEHGAHHEIALGGLLSATRRMSVTGALSSTFDAAAEGRRNQP
jgi:hypothetical protein